ncbi:MAG: hypothetical protein Q9196_006409 [Gyalolechia fulgens]
MTDSTEYPSFGSTCDACGRPDMSNMTWDDGVKHFFSTILSAPRMWPLGFILDSPYSPLRLEQDVPALNWRDAFEDLLALEAGRPMIPEENRKAEDLFAAGNRFKMASWGISAINYLMQDREKLQAMFQEAHRAALKHKDKRKAESISENQLGSLKSDQERHAAHAQHFKAEYEEQTNSTASSLKPRGQWIASLMNSGALPAWNWMVHNSIKGPVLTFHRNDAPPGLENDGITISELEILQHFEAGRPFSFESPIPLPIRETRAVIDGNAILPHIPVPNDPYEKFRPNKNSVMVQFARSEPVELPDGSIGSKTVITNRLANETIETKEFMQQPARLLEEVENARKSMEVVRENVRVISEDYSGESPLKKQRSEWLPEVKAQLLEWQEQD